MSNVSKNSIELISMSSKKLKGKYGKGFLATLVFLLPIMACMFSFYAIPVAVLFWGVLQTGYIRYMRDLIDDKNPSIKMIFSEFSNPFLEIFLGVILLCMFVLGGVLLIVPGVILVALYSMSLFFAEYNKATLPWDAMKQCRKGMKDNYTNMLSFKVLYWLVYVIILVLSATGVAITFKLWADYKALAIVCFLIDFIFTTCVWAVVTTYYQTSCELFFRELLVYGKRREEKDKEDKTIEIITEVEEEVPMENKTEEVKQVKKPATTKKTEGTEKKSTSTTKKASTSTAKKPSAKTSTSTAKKTTTTKKTTSSAKKTSEK